MTNLQFIKRKHTPIILQSEAAECGLACLAMVACHHGHELDLGSLRRRFPGSSRGISLQQMVDFAEQLQLSGRAFRCEPEDLATLQMPVILHWNMKHFVVLTRVRGLTFEVHDPARGRTILSRAELGRQFTGIALEISPTPQFVPTKEVQGIPLASVWRNVNGLRSAGFQVALIALALEAFALAAPLFQQLVIDNVVVTGDRDLLALLAGAFGSLVLLQALVSAARSWALLYLGTLLNLHLVRGLFRHLLRLPVAFFEKRSLGDIISRFSSVDFVQKTLTSNFIAALIDGVLVVGALILMFIYSWQLSLVAVVAVAMYGSLRLLSFQRLRTGAEEAIVRSAKQNTHLLETVRGIGSVKLFSQESQRQGIYESLLVSKVNAEVQVQTIAIGLQATNLAILGIEGTVIIFFGAGFVINGTFSLGMLFAFLSYRLQFSQRASTLFDKLNELRLLTLHLSRLGDVLLTEPEPPQGDVGETPDEMTLCIDNMSFKYAPEEQSVVNSFSAKIAPGEIVAIRGPSGCGKTTILKLVLGLIKPQVGAVYFSTDERRPLDTKTYRAQFGAVLQDDALFEGSIGDNISFFAESPDENQLRLVARLAGIHEDIERMPMKYHTLIGDMGSSLSGGQRQRVLLARALYKRPRVLVLDEATCHVDPAQEAQISRGLRQLGITIIMVAHRAETIALANRVIDLVSPRPSSMLSAVHSHLGG